MNFILIVFRFLIEAKNYKSQIAEQAEEFDQTHGIQSPAAKRMAWLLMALKVVAISSIMGEFPFLDILPGIVTLGEKLGWFGVLMVLVAASVVALIMIAQGEKDEQRIQVHSQLSVERQKQQVINRRAQRQRRKNSPFLPDH